MDSGRDISLGQYKWHITIICIAAVVVILLGTLTDIFDVSQGGLLPKLLWLLGAVVIFIALLAILSKISQGLDVARETGAKLDKAVGSMERMRAGLAQIDQSAHLSEATKAIAFRDANRQSLREAVFDKLQQQDFEAANEIIEEIAHCPEYKQLAEQLKVQAEHYSTATDQERVDQVISHIEKLLEYNQWPKASAQIERLISAHPDSEKAKAMRQQLVGQKEERKKILLAAWDDAVKRQATDRGLEILRELDMYLTSNEALALQEAASGVFRTKLHNLGVQFSLAVTNRQWAQALEVGRQIVRDFPNSRMSTEIRAKLDVLQQKAGQQTTI